jgi:xanthine dehydrogenase YagR molybdenum-binding subunit
MHTLALGCEALRVRLAAVAVTPGSPLAGCDPAHLRFRTKTLAAPDGRCAQLSDLVARSGSDRITTLAEFVPPNSGKEALDAIRAGRIALKSGSADTLSWAFGAQFAEVHVHGETGEIRVARLTGAFAAGRILNPLTARSQLVGGMLWGLGSALLEETVVDAGHYRNDDLAEYLVPTFADTPAMEAILVPDADTEVNPLALKGLGELGIIGVNAAIANAVFNATGKRVRRLPIRSEALV